MSFVMQPEDSEIPEQPQQPREIVPFEFFSATDREGSVLDFRPHVQPSVQQAQGVAEAPKALSATESASGSPIADQPGPPVPPLMEGGRVAPLPPIWNPESTELGSSGNPASAERESTPVPPTPPIPSPTIPSPTIPAPPSPPVESA